MVVLDFMAPDPHSTIHSPTDHIFLRLGVRAFWLISVEEHPDGVELGEFHTLHFTILRDI